MLYPSVQLFKGEGPTKPNRKLNEDNSHDEVLRVPAEQRRNYLQNPTECRRWQQWRVRVPADFFKYMYRAVPSPAS